MISKEIEELESRLANVRGMVEADEIAVAESAQPSVERVFLASSKKLRRDLEARIRIAKAERAHEVVRLRLEGPQMSAGTIQLRSLLKIASPLNACLEQSAWRIWDKEGDADRIDERFIRQVDLRLAAINSGSTELVVLGNTSPDLTGESALESGLRNLFKLLASSVESFAVSVDDVGKHACKSLSALMVALERENVAAEMEWYAPEQEFRWEGRPSEITRIRALLEEVGEPVIERVEVDGVVQVLSVRGKIELLDLASQGKVLVSYHRTLQDQVNDLRLGDRRIFVLERSTYPTVGVQKKRDAYRLFDILRPRRRPGPPSDLG
jgi:hypothetical protein